MYGYTYENGGPNHGPLSYEPHVPPENWSEPSQHYGFSIGGWHLGKYASKAKDAVSDWSPGDIAGGAYSGIKDTTGWGGFGSLAGSAASGVGSGLSSIGSGLKGALGGVMGGIMGTFMAPFQIFGEGMKTLEFTMMIPLLIGGAIAIAIAIVMVSLIVKKMKKNKSSKKAPEVIEDEEFVMEEE